MLFSGKPALQYRLASFNSNPNTMAICCLLVEDDPEDQEFFLDTLHCVAQNAGCYAVSNGEEALTALVDEEFSPDIIFTDMNMPKLDGLGFIRRLREIERFKEIPIVIYSSHLSEKQIEEARSLSVSAIYSKTRIGALRNILARHLPASTES